ncbi:hypothetical protein [Paenirhodobacter populi]|uniref:Uncharacterized protein n=1 Tax=Paenirhodobacter populi TaxID=2306993 RepID=A0A443JDB8_9RHOB|nr:hypothetical protein [Sinirhodobacter populi]RWR18525.1 hypothetical protein D2T30_16170 [Sinirhodobacter populi]
MTEVEVDQILTLQWPAVVRRAMAEGDAWSRKFACSIARQGKRPGWMPTPKQEFLMRAALAEMGGGDAEEWSPIDPEDTP